MKARQTAALAIKLMAVYILLRFIPAIPMILGVASVMLSSHTAVGMKLLHLVLVFTLPAIWIAVALIVIRFAGDIAARLVGETGEQPGTSAPSSMPIMRLIIVGLGLVTFINALPELLRHVVSLGQLRYMQPHPSTAQWRARAIGTFLGSGVQLALGAYLVARPMHVAALIGRLQRGERTPEQ